MRSRRRITSTGDAALVRRAAARLGLQAALGTALVVAVLAGVTLLVFVRFREAGDNAELVDTVAHVDDVGDPPPGMWLTIRSPSGTVSTPGEPAGLPLTAALDRVGAGGPPEVTEVMLGQRDVLVRTDRGAPSTGPPTVVQAVMDLTPGHHQLMRLLDALLVVGLVGLGLAAVVGPWLARRAVRPLEAALTLQRRFVADASHELRTPLTLLSTRVQLLRRHQQGAGTDADALRAEVDGVARDARRLADILDDLLLASDPRGDEPGEAVDLAATAQDVADSTAPAAAAAGVAVRARLPSGPAGVVGSAAGLRRAVTALVDNAIRHADTEVVIEVSCPGRVVRVEIADDGPGIRADILPHLFERFASTGAVGGVGPRRYGLGLALVSEIVERHGGRMTAQNGPDRGATISIELPRSRRDCPDPDTP